MLMKRPGKHVLHWCWQYWIHLVMNRYLKTTIIFAITYLYIFFICIEMRVRFLDTNQAGSTAQQFSHQFALTSEIVNQIILILLVIRLSTTSDLSLPFHASLECELSGNAHHGMVPMRLNAVKFECASALRTQPHSTEFISIVRIWKSLSIIKAQLISKRQLMAPIALCYWPYK